ncbi:MAG: S8 family serine peptidase [Planctomycetota bacterium]
MRRTAPARSTYRSSTSAGHPPLESFTTDPLVQACARAVDAGVVAASALRPATWERAATSASARRRTVAGERAVRDRRGRRCRSSTHGDARRRRMAAFSSQGPTVIDGLLKPGSGGAWVGVLAAIPGSTRRQRAAGAQVVAASDLGAASAASYLALSGTSAATPIVAGTAALLRQANPSLTPGAVKLILEQGREARHLERKPAQGAGLLNAEGAMRMARMISPQADQIALGESWLGDGAALLPVSLIGDRPASFGCALVWGRALVWEPVLGADAGAVQPLWGGDAPFEGQPRRSSRRRLQDALVSKRLAFTLAGCEAMSEDQLALHAPWTDLVACAPRALARPPDRPELHRRQPVGDRSVGLGHDRELDQSRRLVLPAAPVTGAPVECV